MIDANRKREYREKQFLAGIQGVKLPDLEDETQQAIEEVKRRAAIRLAGGEEAVEREEFAEFGIAFETV